MSKEEMISQLEDLKQILNLSSKVKVNSLLHQDYNFDVLKRQNLTITPNDDQPIINHVWLKSEKISDQDVLNELAAEVLYGKSYAEVKSQWDEEEREFNEKGG